MDINCHRFLLEQRHFADEVMILFGIIKLVKISIICLDQGVKINSGVLQHIGTFGGVPSHHRCVVYTHFLNNSCLEIIQTNAWPSNSPHLNAINYTVRGKLECDVFRSLEGFKKSNCSFSAKISST